MAALSDKLLSAGTLTNPAALGGILQAVNDDVVLDQNWDLLSFAQQLHGLSAGAVTFRTVPTGSTDLQTPDDGAAVAIDPAQVQAFIQNTINPTAPPPATAPPVSPRAPVHPDGSVDTVEVLNGSGRGGAASTTLDALTSAGFSPSDTADADTQTTTTVEYSPSDQADAAAAQAVLGPGTVLSPDDQLAPGRLQITLGTDHTEGAATFSGSGSGSGLGPGPAPAAPPPPPPITAAAVPCID